MALIGAEFVFVIFFGIFLDRHYYINIFIYSFVYNYIFINLLFIIIIIYYYLFFCCTCITKQNDTVITGQHCKTVIVLFVLPCINIIMLINK